MTTRRTWGYSGERDRLVDQQDVSSQRLYPDILSAESTFSSISSKELTVDFSKEENFEDEDEQTHSKVITTEHFTRRTLSRLSVPVGNRSRSASKGSSSTGSEAPRRRKSHGEKFQQTHDTVASFFGTVADYVCDIVYFIGLIALICLVGYLLYWMLWPSLPAVTNSLVVEIDAIARQEFGGDRRVRAVLKYIFEILSDDTPKAPVAVLLVGQANITEQFMRPLRQLLVDHYGREPLDLPISADGSATRRQLEEPLADYLNADVGNRVVFMRSIERLPKMTPLLLHALCDSETAPYKNLLLIATLSSLHLPLSVVSRNGGPLTTLQKRECDEHVTNYLLDAWSFLKPDKIHPIVSRISAILLCLV